MTNAKMPTVYYLIRNQAKISEIDKGIPKAAVDETNAVFLMPMGMDWMTYIYVLAETKLKMEGLCFQIFCTFKILQVIFSR